MTAWGHDAAAEMGITDNKGFFYVGLGNLAERSPFYTA